MILSDVISFTLPSNGESKSFCFKTDKGWAKDYNVSINTVQRAIASLKKKGYIRSVYEPTNHKRYLYPTNKCNYDYEAKKKEALNTAKHGNEKTVNKASHYNNNLTKKLKKIWN